MFIKCSVEGCKSKPFPIDLGAEEKPTKCPACDPDAHKKAKRELNEKSKINNSGKKLDAGRVISLEEGGLQLSGEGVEVDVPLNPDAGINAQLKGLKIPVISAAEAEAQAVAKLTPGQKAARTRKLNAAKK